MGHGCENCGSVPLAKEGNDPEVEGVLTVNYVKENVCVGMCRPSGVLVDLHGVRLNGTGRVGRWNEY